MEDILAVIQMCDPYCGSEEVCLNSGEKIAIGSRFHCHNMGNVPDYDSLG